MADILFFLYLMEHTKYCTIYYIRGEIFMENLLKYVAGFRTNNKRNIFIASKD
jgi:hypothetical protein